MKRSFQQFFDDLTRKAHVYPPLELYTELDFETVCQAWQAFAQEDPVAPFGIYIHLPFCERKCSSAIAIPLISGERSAYTRYVTPYCVKWHTWPSSKGAVCRHGLLGAERLTMSGSAYYKAFLKDFRTLFVR